MSTFRSFHFVLLILVAFCQPHMCLFEVESTFESTCKGQTFFSVFAVVVFFLFFFSFLFSSSSSSSQNLWLMSGTLCDFLSFRRKETIC